MSVVQAEFNRLPRMRPNAGDPGYPVGTDDSACQIDSACCGEGKFQPERTKNLVCELIGCAAIGSESTGGSGPLAGEIQPGVGADRIDRAIEPAGAERERSARIRCVNQSMIGALKLKEAIGDKFAVRLIPDCI